MRKLTRTFSLVFVFALSVTAFITGVNAQFMQDPGRNIKKKTSQVNEKTKVILPGRTNRVFTYRASAVGNEVRAFDFTDNFYSGYGFIPSMIIDRHNGTDGRSVIDANGSKSYRDVRVIETSPLNNAKGHMFFYAELGRFTPFSFVDVPSQKNVVRMAEKYPIYAFPSMRTAGKERQVRIGEIGNSYFAENLLGVSQIVDVFFTDLATTKAGGQYLASVLGPNGAAEDGSYRIRNMEEVQDLTLAGYLTQRPRLDVNGEPIYLIAKVFQNPMLGGITNDAYLKLVLTANSQPLPSETNYQLQFECLRTSGSWCG